MHGRLTSGAVFVLYERLDSTSLELKRRAEAGARGPIWIAAVEQTGGYGRRGAAWEQAPGDIAASFLFDPRSDRETFGQLSFVAALAATETIARFAPGAPLALKWPNDVLADGGKIAGLLLELIETPSRPLIALGLGVNIVSKPVLAEYPAARLVDWLSGGAAPSPQDFIAVYDEAFEAWRGRWRDDGFASVRAAWLERAAGKGEKIRVRLPGETLEGVFQDLDSNGALVLECEGETRQVSAGTIVRT